MIHVISSKKYSEACSLLVAAIRRSVSKSQCKSIQVHEINECANILVAIAPDEFMGKKIIT